VADGGVTGGGGERRGERIKASPLARRIARERGLDLGAVRGSGPGGRIVRADVVAATGAVGTAATGPPDAAGTAAGPRAPAAEPTLAERVATAKGETTSVELTRTQQTIARRMAESKATIPDFTLQAEVDMEECVRLRSELKRLSQREAPTYNDMVVKAGALALREHPRVNGTYRDGVLQLHSRVNVGVAVAAEQALVVPTVFDADEKSLGEIAREARALAEKVRAGTITPPELGGGTFTVSNLGMYGVRSFTAIINPPQAAILSVGSLEARAVVREGEVLARHTLLLTLACDHRILYGADAAQFLARIRELLEAPAALTL
jgi:pyruvate dehydrogenase E2 component (dihydrolipoamide acetyltransferase)